MARASSTVLLLVVLMLCVLPSDMPAASPINAPPPPAWEVPNLDRVNSACVSIEGKYLRAGQPSPANIGITQPLLDTYLLGFTVPGNYRAIAEIVGERSAAGELKVVLHAINDSALEKHSFAVACERGWWILRSQRSGSMDGQMFHFQKTLFLNKARDGALVMALDYEHTDRFFFIISTTRRIEAWYRFEHVR